MKGGVQQPKFNKIGMEPSQRRSMSVMEVPEKGLKSAQI